MPSCLMFLLTLFGVPAAFVIGAMLYGPTIRMIRGIGRAFRPEPREPRGVPVFATVMYAAVLAIPVVLALSHGWSIAKPCNETAWLAPSPVEDAVACLEK